jgi:hypothetical protein
MQGSERGEQLGIDGAVMGQSWAGPHAMGSWAELAVTKQGVPCVASLAQHQQQL